VDYVVNTNVLLYLGDNYPKVSEYINNSIKNNEPKSVYYPDDLSFYYMVSRAVENNISSLGKNKKLIIKNVLARRNKNGSFGNPLQTALATVTLINFSYKGTEIKNAIKHIIKTQNQNGSWSREIFYTDANFEVGYFGSEELTTGLCLEALQKYKDS
jgi:hypothetical protein